MFFSKRRVRCRQPFLAYLFPGGRKMVDKKSDKPASSAGKGAAGKTKAFPTIPPLSCIPKTIPFVNCPPPKTLPGVSCPLPPEDAEKGFPTLACVATLPGVNCPIMTMPVSSCLPAEAAEGEASEAAFPTIPFSSCLPATIPGVSCPVPTVPIVDCMPRDDDCTAGALPLPVTFMCDPGRPWGPSLSRLLYAARDR